MSSDCASCWEVYRRELCTIGSEVNCCLRACLWTALYPFLVLCTFENQLTEIQTEFKSLVGAVFTSGVALYYCIIVRYKIYHHLYTVK